MSEKTVDELHSEAELKKLNLEIENLMHKNKWENGVARYLSTITIIVSVIPALVGIGVFGWGIYTYKENREKERTKDKQDQIRVDQDQFRANYNHLLEITNPDAQTNYRVTTTRLISVLEELKALNERLPEEGKARRRDQVTKLLTEFILEESVLTNPRHVFFDLIAMRYWDDYQAYFRDNPENNSFVIYNYTQALRQVHEKQPIYFETLTHDSEAGRYIVGPTGYTEESLYRHFESLVRGFRTHLNLLQPGSAKWREAVADFQDAIKNPKLTEQLFGSNAK